MSSFVELVWGACALCVDAKIDPWVVGVPPRKRSTFGNRDHDWFSRALDGFLGVFSLVNPEQCRNVLHFAEIWLVELDMVRKDPTLMSSVLLTIW